jgi:hypothetical protein
MSLFVRHFWRQKIECRVPKRYYRSLRNVSYIKKINFNVFTCVLFNKLPFKMEHGTYLLSFKKLLLKEPVLH